MMIVTNSTICYLHTDATKSLKFYADAHEVIVDMSVAHVHTHNIINIAQIVNCVGRKQIYLNANDARILFIKYANVISLSLSPSIPLSLSQCVCSHRSRNK